MLMLNVLRLGTSLAVVTMPTTTAVTLGAFGVNFPEPDDDSHWEVSPLGLQGTRDQLTPHRLVERLDKARRRSCGVGGIFSTKPPPCAWPVPCLLTSTRLACGRGPPLLRELCRRTNGRVRRFLPRISGMGACLSPSVPSASIEWDIFSACHLLDARVL